jgi:hypothetical protein
VKPAENEDVVAWIGGMPHLVIQRRMDQVLGLLEMRSCQM